MELEESLETLQELGLGVTAISYDSVEILKNFDDRQGGFSYSLLADPRSEVIEQFGLLNPNIPEGHPGHGTAFPGTYIVDSDGMVQEKYFEQMHRQRYTADTVILREFGVGGGSRVEAQLPQFKLTVYPSQDEIRPGNRIVLVADFELAERAHLYAPGSDYTAVDLRVVEHPMLLQGALNLPEPEIIYLDVIDESVPVYRDSARIDREVTLSPNYIEPTIEIEAVLHYQTCDDVFCYLPAELPLSFQLDVTLNDTLRAPETIRHQGENTPIPFPVEEG